MTCTRATRTADTTKRGSCFRRRRTATSSRRIRGTMLRGMVGSEGMGSRPNVTVGRGLHRGSVRRGILKNSPSSLTTCSLRILCKAPPIPSTPTSRRAFAEPTNVGPNGSAMSGPDPSIPNASPTASKPATAWTLPSPFHLSLMFLSRTSTRSLHFSGRSLYFFLQEHISYYDTALTPHPTEAGGRSRRFTCCKKETSNLDTRKSPSYSVTVYLLVVYLSCIV